MKTNPRPQSKGVYTLEELRRWTESGPLRLDSGHRPVLAVFGDPVAHSLSPQMMNPALDARGIEGEYIRLHVTPEEFTEALRLLPGLGFAGANVTIPHKFSALRSMDEVDPLAEKLGAVNTVRVGDGGRLQGSNSDGPGFVRALREAFGADVAELRVIVLGAGGGAGRAVAIQCALSHCRQLTLVNRTRDKAEQLAAELTRHDPGGAFDVMAWTPQALEERLPQIDLIVNGTSLGMKSGDPELVPSGLLQPHHCIFDMVYQPQQTPLILAAQRAGAQAVNGLTMLLHQGAISFETWFGGPVPLEAMRDGLTRAAMGIA